MASLGQMKIGIDGVEHVVDLKKIDILRAEEATQTSITRLEGTMRAVYAFAYAAARREKVEGIPDTFEAFLDLDPDVEDVEGPGEEGKGSGQVPPTG